MDGHSVTDARSRVTDDGAAISRPGVAALGVVGGGGGGGLRDTEDVGPFEDLLAVIVVVKGSVTIESRQCVITRVSNGGRTQFRARASYGDGIQCNQGMQP
jgi:hypothetical protein